MRHILKVLKIGALLFVCLVLFLGLYIYRNYFYNPGEKSTDGVLETYLALDVSTDLIATIPSCSGIKSKCYTSRYYATTLSIDEVGEAVNRYAGSNTRKRFIDGRSVFTGLNNSNKPVLQVNGLPRGKMDVEAMIGIPEAEAYEWRYESPKGKEMRVKYYNLLGTEAFYELNGEEFEENILVVEIKTL